MVVAEFPSDSSGGLSGSISPSSISFGDISICSPSAGGSSCYSTCSGCSDVSECPGWFCERSTLANVSAISIDCRFEVELRIGLYFVVSVVRDV